MNAELDAITHDLPDQFIVCRDIGHSWRAHRFTKDESATGRGLFVRRLECLSCGTKRFDYVTRSGTVYGRRYEYPEHYQIKGFGTRTADRSIYRRISLERAGHLDRKARA